MSAISSVSSEVYNSYQSSAVKQETAKTDKNQSTEAAKEKETTSSATTKKDGVVYEKNNQDYKTKNAAYVADAVSCRKDVLKTGNYNWKSR